MLELIGGLFATAASGGVLGIVGGLVRQGLDYFNKRQELANELALVRERNAHELAMRDKDKELMVAEADNRLKVTRIEGETAIETARMQAIGASFESDKATFATGEAARNSDWFVAVDVVRGLIRPGITLLFDLSMLVIWIVLISLLWDELARLFAAKDPMVIKPMMDMILEITKAIIFLAMTATGYWFVARPHSGNAS